ncbi:MAG: diacylglycerol kinase family lipid kinase [Limnochordia bacterium]|nr:diacylglycerol kinase family lipid kinase [Limnochordia bacterium]
MDRKILCIVNRTAGAGRTGRLWPRIYRRMKQLNLKVDCVYTEGPYHASSLAAKSTADFSELVAVGGDGTINEVVNGMLGSSSVLGIIPTGKGNDLARTLGIPRNFELALERLQNRVIRHVDVVQLGDTHFINGASVGFDAEVAHQVNCSVLPFRGMAAYVGAALKTLYRFKGCSISIELDDEKITKRGLMVVVANGQYYGGGMKIVPPADLSDGFLDICLVEELGKMSFLANLGRVYSGNHMNHPRVKFYRSKKIKITTERPLRLQADGELIGTTPCKIAVKPRAIAVLA